MRPGGLRRSGHRRSEPAPRYTRRREPGSAAGPVLSGCRLFPKQESRGGDKTMTGTSILAIAFAFVFLYTLLSLVCSVFNEWIARWLDFRKTILREELRRLLPKALLDRVEAHPLIGFGRKKSKYQDYLPPSTFALALIDLTVKFTPGPPGYPGKVEV